MQDQETCGECGKRFTATEGKGEWAHSLAYGFVCGECLRREAEDEAEQIEQIRRDYNQ